MIEWKEYRLNDVFIVKHGNNFDKIKMTFQNATINFISRTMNNNGLLCKVDMIYNIKPFQSGSITLSLVGEGRGACFIQNEDFYTTQNMLVLIPKTTISKNIKMFLTTSITTSARKKYDAYTHTLHGNLHNFTFSLPTINNEIAWDLMDRYIRRLESKILDKKKINVNSEVLNKPVDMSNWKEFNFFDIFDKNYQIGDSKKITTLEGDIALVSAGESNNGIDSFVKYNSNNKLFNENQITLAKNGSVGTMNYQNQKFYATSDIMVLKLKDYELNKYIALFLKVFCEREFKLNYSWSNKITLKVLEKTKIQLPTTQNGEIDWQYMENFMKNVEKEAIIN